MMETRKFVVAGLSLLWAFSVLAYDVNKDLRNLGPAAYDIAVVLAGNESIIGHYDGYPSGKFASFSHGPHGANYRLHWQHFWDGNDNRIDNGQVIHVGWSTADHASSVLDIYWTDQCGERIAGSVVYNITSGWTYESSSGVCHATWNHNFAGESLVEISNIQFATSFDSYALADLNGQNRVLAQNLRPLHDGNVTLCNNQSFSIAIPESLGRSVVLVYDVNARDSSAQSRDFVQFHCFPDNSNAHQGQ
jgi:hypothetical protein